MKKKYYRHFYYLKNTISKEYLTQIHNRHEEWLLRENHKNTTILVLNGDKEFENDPT